MKLSKNKVSNRRHLSSRMNENCLLMDLSYVCLIFQHMAVSDCLLSDITECKKPGAISDSWWRQASLESCTWLHVWKDDTRDAGYVSGFCKWVHQFLWLSLWQGDKLSKGQMMGGSAVVALLQEPRNGPGKWILFPCFKKNRKHCFMVHRGIFL